jgi:hypothetical protein
MTVKGVWDNEEQMTLRYDFAGAWTWDEFDTEFRRCAALMRDLPHTVDFICNMTNARHHLPPNAISHVINLYRLELPNAGRTVVVGASALITSIASVGIKIFPNIARRYAFKTTLGEARDYLAWCRRQREADPGNETMLRLKGTNTPIKPGGK